MYTTTRNPKLVVGCKCLLFLFIFVFILLSITGDTESYLLLTLLIDHSFLCLLSFIPAPRLVSLLLVLHHLPRILSVLSSLLFYSFLLRLAEFLPHSLCINAPCYLCETLFLQAALSTYNAASNT